jgi:integrase
MWEFFWWETGPEGERKRKHAVLGSAKELNRKAAEDEADIIRLRINSVQHQPAILKFAMVAADYTRHELESERSRLAYPTKKIYGIYIRRWILDRWANEHLERIRGVDVEQWLDSLDLAAGSKAKIRNIMSGIYSHAKRQGMTQFNPISTVRQTSQRECVPDVLTPAEARAIAEEVELRKLVLAVLGMGNGPRPSESLALKWEDIDFPGRQMTIRRSIWQQRINENCKTAKAKKPVPLHPLQIAVLLEWRRTTPYRDDKDWIFASQQMQGKQPLWPERLRRNLQAVVKRLGIPKKVGWYTFRHTLSTMLRANGEDIATQIDLMRNSAKVALDHYTQAIPEEKRAAQTRVLDMIFGNDSANGTFRNIAGSPTIN